jgi:hypothetical protein
LDFEKNTFKWEKVEENPHISIIFSDYPKNPEELSLKFFLKIFDGIWGKLGSKLSIFSKEKEV